MKRLFLIILSAFVLFSACVKEKKEEKKEPAAPAVLNFTLKDLEGRTVTLAGLRGKVVLLEFWATWCAPCRTSVPGTVKLYETYGSKGLEVLGISLDDGGWDSVKAFRKDYKITYPVLKGTDDVAEQFGVRTIPMFILLDRDGQVVNHYLGSGNEEIIEKKIKTLLAG